MVCRKCDAKCCRYFALQISAPRNRADTENVRWYLAHRNVSVFIHRRRWYMEIANECEYITEDNRCAIYDRRPLICREHASDDCEYHSCVFEHEVVFKNIDDFDEYLAKKKNRRKRKGSHDDGRTGRNRQIRGKK